MSKLHSKFYFIHDGKKSQDCTSKSPNPKSTPNSQDPGKIPSSGSARNRNIYHLWL